MKFIYTFLLLVIFVFAGYAQEKSNLIYQVQAIYEKADFNKKAIKVYEKNQDLWGDGEEVIKTLAPIKGKHKIILFMLTLKGKCHKGGECVVHRVLLLKINKKNEIVEGLHYPLEWAEPPNASELYKVTQKGVKLKKGLDLSKLKFKSVFPIGNTMPEGVIDNIYKLEEVF